MTNAIRVVSDAITSATYREVDEMARFLAERIEQDTADNVTCLAEFRDVLVTWAEELGCKADFEGNEDA